MSGRAESGEAERITVLQFGEPERTPSDRSRAEQWRELDVGDFRRERNRERRRHCDRFGVSAGRDAPRGNEPRAKIFLFRATIAANAARPVNPRHTHAVAGAQVRNARAHARDAANHLVSGNDGILGWCDAPFDDVEIGATDAADIDAHQNLPFARRRHWNIGQLEWSGIAGHRRRMPQEHGPHRESGLSR